MRTTLLLLLFFQIAGALAQKHALEFSMALINDKNFNIPAGDHPSFFLLGGTLPTIDNRYSISSAISFEKKTGWLFNPVISVRLISRKINYVYFNTVLDDFTYNTIEIPLGIRLRKKINDQCIFRFDIGGGANFVITSDNKTVTSYPQVTFPFSEPTTRFQFIHNKKPAWFAQTSIGFESKISSNKTICLYMAYQFQLTSLFHFYSFNQSNNAPYWAFENYSGSVKTSYLSFGAIYAFSFGGKKETANK